MGGGGAGDRVGPVCSGRRTGFRYRTKVRDVRCWMRRLICDGNDALPVAASAVVRVRFAT